MTALPEPCGSRFAGPAGPLWTTGRLGVCALWHRESQPHRRGRTLARGRMGSDPAGSDPTASPPRI